MSRRDLLLDMVGPDALFADGFDDCILGVVAVDGTPRVLYSRELIIAQLMRTDKCDYESAAEHFDYNIEGSYVGDEGPLFATLIDVAEEETARDHPPS